MKYLVKINLDSIKKNERAGETSTSVVSNKKYIFVGYYPLPKLFNKENCIITSLESKPLNESIKVTGEITDVDVFNEVMKNRPDNYTLSIEQEFEEHKHSPIPEYSYSYENKEVVCNSCGTKIKIEDLESDYTECCYSNEICPKCESWGCVSLEYEKIEDALKRKNKYGVDV